MSLVEQIHNQYKASFKMLISCITQYDESVWYDNKNYDCPAYKSAYHAINCANMYCAPNESKIVRWNGEVNPKENKLSINDMVDFCNHVLNNVPKYLTHFNAEEECWPDWYELKQLEFQFNNLRHIQHHTAQLIERHRSFKKLEIKWESMK